MKLKLLFIFIALSIVLNSEAQVRNAGKKAKKSYIKLIEAYTQRTLPGIKESPTSTDTHFIIIWEGTQYPETFFWRGENGWLTCKMVKAHKINQANKRSIPAGLEYMEEMITNDKVNKGDTLALTPIKGGRFAVPKEVTNNIKNTLFFKTAGSSWLKFPITKIGTKKDILMP